MKKLNLGAGATRIEGFEARDIKNGDSLIPLPDSDASVDEIYASHVLEHFSHRQTLDVLKEWARAIKPGGLMKIAVPNFEYIARGFLNGQAEPWQGYLAGGHIDQHDVHLAHFDEGTLGQLMRDAGLVGVHRWNGNGDCSALPVSLNLAAWKPPASWPKVYAVMSVPRLGFMDNFFCAAELVARLRIPIRKSTGAFWGQCMTRAIEEALAEGAEWVLTIDYDSVYTVDTAIGLLSTAIASPQVDALVPIQMSRMGKHPLMTVLGDDGNEVLAGIDRERMDATLLPIKTGHFGLTLLRASKFASLAKPWFIGHPAPDGTWNDERVDDDIHFWNVWRAAGNSIHCAPRCVIGHAELQVIWPDQNLEPVFQHASEFWKEGEPRGVWR